MHYPGFHIVQDVDGLSIEEREKRLKKANTLPTAGFKVPFAPPDFLISPGRYYVDGILCENEQITSYLNQLDLPDATPIRDPGVYLVYLDVWERLLTALDDPSIREIALGEQQDVGIVYPRRGAREEQVGAAGVGGQLPEEEKRDRNSGK